MLSVPSNNWLFQVQIACFKSNLHVWRSHCLFQDYIACFKITLPVSRSYCMFQDHIACFKTTPPVSRSICLVQVHWLVLMHYKVWCIMTVPHHSEDPPWVQTRTFQHIFVTLYPADLQDIALQCSSINVLLIFFADKSLSLFLLLLHSMFALLLFRHGSWTAWCDRGFCQFPASGLNEPNDLNLTSFLCLTRSR